MERRVALFSTKNDNEHCILRYRWAYGLHRKDEKAFRFVLVLLNSELLGGLEENYMEKYNIVKVKKYKELPDVVELMKEVNKDQEYTFVKGTLGSFVYTFYTYKDLLMFIAKVSKIFSESGILPCSVIDRASALPSVTYGNDYLQQTLDTSASIFDLEDFIKKQAGINELRELFVYHPLQVDSSIKFKMSDSITHDLTETIVEAMFDLIQTVYNSHENVSNNKGKENKEHKVEKEDVMSSLGLWI